MTLREQLSNKCIFFTGIQFSKCACGVPYEDVRIGKPYKFPCLNQGGYCEKRKFLTKEEVDSEMQEIESFINPSLSAFAKVRNHFDLTKERHGKLKCDCGGDLNFKVSTVNDHISANCQKCGVSIRE